MKNILIYGGTGAMGVPLVGILKSKFGADGCSIYVTSRRQRPSDGCVNYICGNASDPDFCRQTLAMRRWDVVIDFIVRRYDNLKALLPDFLANAGQYVFISSARVYDRCDGKIHEYSPRLLDASTDSEFLSTNEYSLAKAREENLLFESGSRNFTIIRPSITYNTYRLQLGVFEKEDWLYRALHGKTIVFSHDMMDKLTTNTLGTDVAAGIAAVVGEERAAGRVFHITQPEAVAWGEILDIYIDTLSNKLGREVKVRFTDRSTNFLWPEKKYQLIYCRYFNREFDNSAINEFIDTSTFASTRTGLEQCLTEFLENPVFGDINWELEAIHDRITGERTPLSKIPGKKSKLKYWLCRNHLRGLYKLLIKITSHK